MANHTTPKNGRISAVPLLYPIALDDVFANFIRIDYGR